MMLAKKLHKKLNKCGLITEKTFGTYSLREKLKGFSYFLHRVESPCPLLLVFALSGVEWISTPTHPPLRSKIPLNQFFFFVDGRGMTLFN